MGARDETGEAIALESPGGWFTVVGSTRSPDFPATGPWRSLAGGTQDVPLGLCAYPSVAPQDLAKRLLANTDTTVAEVAYASGFHTPSVFHEHFKRLTGMTPTAYRDTTRGARP